MSKKPRFEEPEGGQDAGLEHWLRTEGVRRYDAWRREPNAQSAEEVFEELRKHHARLVKLSR